MFFILILLSYALVAGAKKKVTDLFRPDISSGETVWMGGKRKAEPKLRTLFEVNEIPPARLA
jgi:hypothetical protein